MSRFDLSIGDFVARTGVAEPTLRVWERRHGFPAPMRTDSGHRRYSEEQVQAVERVLALRESGLSLPAAIARSQTPPGLDSISLFSTLRQSRPDLEPRLVRKPALIAFSHAIEDEVLARAQGRIMFACFQRERFYRSSEGRWRELAATTRVAVVFADFPAVRQPDGGPAEVPICGLQQIAREWAIVVHGDRSSICMVARERASSNVRATTAARSFELLWTVEPEAVRAMANVCIGLTRDATPELAISAGEALAIDSPATPAEQVRLTTAVINRTLSEMA